ncbi:MAG: fibronectin type III domain-containing protein [Cyclobacteriaceae bacterium]
MNRIYKSILFVIIVQLIFFLGCTPEIQEFIDPIPISVQPEKITTTGFTATWKPLLGAKSYIVEVAMDGSFDEEFLINETPVEVEDTFLVVQNLEVAHTYYYRLIAQLSTGEQTRFSDIVAVNTLGMPTPLALSASEIGPTRFTAKWQKIDEAEIYEVEVASDIEFTNSSSVQRIVTKDTSVIIKDDLKVDQDYFYRVLARNEDITSGFSNTIHLITTELTKPVIEETRNVTQNEFAFSWQPVTGAVDYTIEVTTDPLFLEAQSFLVQNEIVSGTQFLLDNLNANTTYYFRVRANNEKSFSEYSDKGTVTTQPLDVPVALAGSNIQRNSFQANWQTVPSAESYRLDVAADEYFTQFVSGYEGLMLNDTSVEVTGLQQNTTYYYRLTTSGLNSDSNPSNTIQVTTTLLSAPVLHAASDISSTSFTASWSSVEEAENYLLEVSTDPNFSTITKTIQDITDTLYNVQDMKADIMYYYRVRAKEGTNYSSYSNIANQQLAKSPTALDIPTNITASNVTYTEFIISWDVTSDATYYTVDIATDNQFLSIVSGYEEAVTNGTSLLVEGLNENTVYYSRVRAHNTNTASDYSAIISVQTSTIGTPVAQQPITNNAYDIYASWSLVEDASHYLLDVATDAGFTTIVPGYENVSVEATYSMIASLQPSTTYYYRVRAVVEGSPSAYSNAISVTTDNVPVQEASGTLEVESYSQSDGVERVYSPTASGDYYLGSINEGNTVNYEVNVSSSGDYEFQFRVSNNNADNKFIVIKDGGAFIRMVTVPPTGGWDNWQTVSVTLTSLSSGYHDIQLEFTGGTGDEELLRIDWINIQPD